VSYKVDKLNVQILKHLSDIIEFEVKNPKIGFVTITNVEVTRDYSYAKVYVSILEEQKVKATLEALEQAKGYLRTELARRLKTYKCPALIFVQDTSYEDGKKIEKILEALK
jgi:ribosome-binding factor A